MTSNLHHYTDDELIRNIGLAQGSLPPLSQELAERLEVSLEALRHFSPLRDEMDAQGLKPLEVATLLRTLGQFGLLSSDAIVNRFSTYAELGVEG